MVNPYFYNYDEEPEEDSDEFFYEDGSDITEIEPDDSDYSSYDDYINR